MGKRRVDGMYGHDAPLGRSSRSSCDAKQDSGGGKLQIEHPPTLAEQQAAEEHDERPSGPRPIMLVSSK